MALLTKARSYGSKVHHLQQRLFGPTVRIQRRHSSTERLIHALPSRRRFAADWHDEFFRASTAKTDLLLIWAAYPVHILAETHSPAPVSPRPFAKPMPSRQMHQEIFRKYLGTQWQTPVVWLGTGFLLEVSITRFRD